MTHLTPGPSRIAVMTERSTRATNAATGYPCALCSVRPDVGCRHRPADPKWEPADQTLSENDVHRFSQQAAVYNARIKAAKKRRSKHG